MAPSSALKRSFRLSSAIPGQFRKWKDRVSNMWSQQLLQRFRHHPQHQRLPQGQCLPEEEEDHVEGPVQCSKQQPPKQQQRILPPRRCPPAQNSRVQLTALKKRIFQKQNAPKRVAPKPPIRNPELGNSGHEDNLPRGPGDRPRVPEYRVNKIYITNV